MIEFKNEPIKCNKCDRMIIGVDHLIKHQGLPHPYMMWVANKKNVITFRLDYNTTWGTTFRMLEIV